MTDRPAGTLNDLYAPLERELEALRARVSFPATPDIAASIRARLATEPRVVRRPWWTPVVERPWLAAAAAVILLALATLLVSSSARQAVADALGVPGIRIEFGDEDATAVPPQPSPTRAILGLGERTTLHEASKLAGFPIAVPNVETYGHPDEVYVRVLPSGKRMVSFFYLPDDRFPEAEETGAGLLLMQFESTQSVEIMVKGVMGDGIGREVTVNGGRGYWVFGTSSLTILYDPSAPTCCTDAPRPSANVLLWNLDGVTYRLESALDRDESMAVAESMTSRFATPEP